jgi:ATP-dependent exoDNAse (exonuclease V) beta subunit
VKRDGERLAAFGRAMDAAIRRFGHLPPLDVLDGIVADTGYEATLRARPDGMQALANLRAFRALVRAAQAGAAPGEVVRELQRLTEVGDDPAAPGLNLAPGAAVLVTVVHQAKGREWDHVVVPDLDRKKPRMRVEGCDPQRVVHGAAGAVERRSIPSSSVESRKDVFAAERGAGGRVVEEATRGAERAESRRLLYVACTRARKRLVLGGRWPDAARLTSWMRSLRCLALPVARSWMEDVALALQFRPDASERVAPSDVWREGRDFAWVSPAGAGFGEAELPRGPVAPVDPERVRAAARAVEPVPLRVVNPSALPPDPAVPPAEIVRPAVAALPLGPSPFGSADEEGTAFHRAVQLWSYREVCPPALVARAVRDLYGEARLDERTARVSALIERQRAAQPALVTELEAAAARGELHHEVAVGYVRDDGAWVEGSIDLLYLALQKPPQRLYDRREVLASRLPQRLVRDVEVLVHEHVPESAHFRPRDLGVRGDDVVGHAAGSLADDPEAPRDGVDRLLVGQERALVERRGVALDPSDGVEDVLDAESPISRRHGPPRRRCARAAAASRRRA